MSNRQFKKTNNPPYTNPFINKHSVINKQSVNESKVNINDIEQFPSLPSTKINVAPPNSPQNSQTHSWSTIASSTTNNTNPYASRQQHTKHTKYAQEQNVLRRKLQKITEEQLRRDILNEEFGEDSPYWGSKNLLENESEDSSSDLEDN